MNEQKVAFITGITSGIGQAIKNKLVSEGWRVIGTARHLPADQEGYEADLARLDDVEPLCERIKFDAPRLDAFIHVAGVWHDKDAVLAGKKISEFSADQIIHTLNVGLTSAMIMCARLSPNIPQGGKIVLVSGTFNDGGANWLPYYTGKRALEDFLVGLSQENDSIGVFGLSPADTATDAYKKFYPESAGTAQSPDAVAGVCLNILHDKSGASSGTVIEVRDGAAGFGFHR